MACALGWHPDQFWLATPHELFIAIDGHALAQGSDEAVADDRRDRFADFLEAMTAAGQV
jgi:hypothetical protein